jgi:hypothetical protein
MDLTPHTDALRSDLEAAAAGDEASQAVAERIARSLDATVQLRMLDVIGDAALELSEQLPSGHVEVRLAGRDVRLVLVGGPDTVEPGRAPLDDEGETARLTLRMPEGLKTRVETAADREGVSTNAWLVRAVARALDDAPKRRSGNRLTGFAQS